MATQHHLAAISRSARPSIVSSVNREATAKEMGNHSELLPAPLNCRMPNKS
jgi:hypothetical protein